MEWEEFEDTKGVIRNRKSMKNRQHNGQKKKYKRTNNHLQNIAYKTKDGVTRPPLIWRMKQKQLQGSREELKEILKIDPKKDKKKTNNDPQSTTQKTKVWAAWIPLKPRVNTCALVV